MLIFLLALVLASEDLIQARTFNNPIIGNLSYDQPAAIKVNETYYVVTKQKGSGSRSYPIHTSTDLINWKLEQYVFNFNNTPTWALVDLWEIENIFLHPEIHKIGYNYLVYFSALDTRRSYSLGVAIASHPLGPYTPTDRPILTQAQQKQLWEPTIINDEDNLYLVWSEQSSIMARQLNSNGLSFSSDQNITLLSPSLAWENNAVGGAWYIRRGEYHYLVYSGRYGCTFEDSVGVARSSHVLGPYEKQLNPLSLVNNEDFFSAGQVSVVKDLDDKSDIICFSAEPKVSGCYYFNILMVSIGWDEKGWPYVKN